MALRVRHASICLLTLCSAALGDSEGGGSATPPELRGSMRASSTTTTNTPAEGQSAFHPAHVQVVCEDTTGAAVDASNDTCAPYVGPPSECLMGHWDDSDFTATDMCCGCGGGRKVQVEVPDCQDFVPPNATEWHDAGGPKFNCAWYAVGANALWTSRCRKYGLDFDNFGRTADEACCICNGGVRRLLKGA